MKMYCIHADTCPLGQWYDHKAHVFVPIYRGMPVSELRDAIISELNEGSIEGVIGGSDDIADKLRNSHEATCQAAIEAVRNLYSSGDNDKELFLDLEEENFEVFAYFVFSED